MIRNKRKHFFINKTLQGNYILYIVATLVIVATVAGISIYFGMWNAVLQNFSEENIKSRLELSTRLREYASARDELTNEQMTLSMIKEIDLFAAREREILNDMLKNAYKDLAPLFIPLIIFIGWGSIYITHKIAGPLYRLKDSLQKLCDGKCNFRIQLRKHDQAQFLVPLFNAFLMKLDTSFAKLKSLTAALKETAPGTPEHTELIEKITQEIQSYETTRQ